jgi:hypothetical protein
MSSTRARRRVFQRSPVEFEIAARESAVSVSGPAGQHVECGLRLTRHAYVPPPERLACATLTVEHLDHSGARHVEVCNRVVAMGQVVAAIHRQPSRLNSRRRSRGAHSRRHLGNRGADDCFPGRAGRSAAECRRHHDGAGQAQRPPVLCDANYAPMVPLGVLKSGQCGINR